MSDLKKLISFLILVTLAVLPTVFAKCHCNEEMTFLSCVNHNNLNNLTLTCRHGNRSLDSVANIERFTLRNVSGSLNSDMFTNMTALNYLTLSWSTVDSVGANVFAVLPTLQFLVIKHNEKFPNFTKEFFSATNDSDLNLNLNWISLIKNNGQFIEEDSLTLLKNLTWFHVQHQIIERLTPLMFSENDNLHELTINNCQLKLILPQTFDNLVNLEMLSLNFNELQVLPTDLFCNLDKFKVLELHHNKLLQLDLGEFRPLVALEIVGFPSAFLKHLNVTELLETVPNLRKFELKRNDFRRNETKALIQELRQNHVEIIGTPHDCHFPFPPFYSCHQHKIV